MRSIIDFDEEGPMRLLDIAAGDDDLSDEAVGEIHEALTLFYHQKISLGEFVATFDRHMHQKYIIESRRPDVLAASSIDGEVLDKVIE